MKNATFCTSHEKFIKVCMRAQEAHILVVTNSILSIEKSKSKKMMLYKVAHVPLFNRNSGKTKQLLCLYKKF